MAVTAPAIALVVALLGLSSAARAQDTLAIDGYEVDASCPAQDVLVASLRERLQRDPIDVRSNRRAHIAIERNGAALHARIDLAIDDDGATRTIDGEPDCAALVDAIALMLANAIDPAFEEREEHPPPRAASPSRRAPPPVDEADLAFSIRGGFSYGGPAGSLGFLAGVRLRLDPFAFDLAFHLHPEFEQERHSTDLAAIAANGCLEIGPVGPVSFPLCAGVQVGMLGAESRTARQPAHALTPFFALTFTLGVEVAVTDWLTLGYTFGWFVQPATPTTFVVDERPVWTSPRASFETGLTAEVSW